MGYILASLCFFRLLQLIGRTKSCDLGNPESLQIFNHSQPFIRYSSSRYWQVAVYLYFLSLNKREHHTPVVSTGALK